jgi:hypothetical protein
MTKYNLSYNILGQRKENLKNISESDRYFIRPTAVNSFNAIQALMCLAFLIIIVSVHMRFNNFDKCVCI